MHADIYMYVYMKRETERKRERKREISVSYTLKYNGHLVIFFIFMQQNFIIYVTCLVENLSETKKTY